MHLAKQRVAASLRGLRFLQPWASDLVYSTRHESLLVEKLTDFHKGTHTCSQTSTHISHTHLHTYAHTCMHTHAGTHTPAHLCVCALTHTHTCRYTYTHTRKHTLPGAPKQGILRQDDGLIIQFKILWAM